MILFVPAFLAPPTAVFVRHGETVANATGRYSSSTLNVFSAKGRGQVAALTGRLKTDGTFDTILVSPSERCLRTIAPYLRATGRKATVWPLLYECCVGRLPARAAPFRYGGPVTIPADLKGLFVVPVGARIPAPRSKAEEKGQLEASVREWRSRFAGRGRTLIVGHSGHGGKFLRELTGRWIRVENAKEIPVVPGTVSR